MKMNGVCSTEPNDCYGYGVSIVICLFAKYGSLLQGKNRSVTFLIKSITTTGYCTRSQFTGSLASSKYSVHTECTSHIPHACNLIQNHLLKQVLTPSHLDLPPPHLNLKHQCLPPPLHSLQPIHRAPLQPNQRAHGPVGTPPPLSSATSPPRPSLSPASTLQIFDPQRPLERILLTQTLCLSVRDGGGARGGAPQHTPKLNSLPEVRVSVFTMVM